MWEKGTKKMIFPTKKEQFHHKFEQICPHLGQYTGSRSWLYGTQFCPPNMNHIAGNVHISGKSINKIKPYNREIFQKTIYQKRI